MPTSRLLLSCLAALGLPTAALADLVEVRITGTVVSSFISQPPLGLVGPGDAATITFRVDSDVFVDGVPGDTRGYEVIPSSFSLEFDTPVSLGLESPFPSGLTPFFTLVEGFPVSDGFFLSTSTVSPGGVPLEQAPYHLNSSLGYVGSTLGTLDILDALGTYDFTGLTSFGLNLWASFPDNVALEMDFSGMTISLADGPTVFCDDNPDNAAGIEIDTTSCAASSIHVTLTDGPAGQFGYLLVGAGSATLTDPPGAEGDLCLGGSAIGRYVLDLGVIDGAGRLTTDLLNASAGGGGGGLPAPLGGNLCSPPGQTWNFQYWHRRPAALSGFSQAIAVTFQ